MLYAILGIVAAGEVALAGWLYKLHDNLKQSIMTEIRFMQTTTQALSDLYQAQNKIATHQAAIITHITGMSDNVDMMNEVVKYLSQHME